MRWSVGLLALAVAMAGCSASDAPRGTVAEGSGDAGPLGGLGAAANNTTAPPAPVTVELGGCRQVHSFFPFPIALFENLGLQLPEGFTYASDDGHTVHAFLAWWLCAGGLLNNTPNGPLEGGMASMFASLPVVPPAELTAADAHPVPVALDLVPLTWVVSDLLVARHLGDLPGLRDGYVAQGEVGYSQGGLGSMHHHSLDATAPFGTFSLDAPVQAGGGGLDANRYRLWLAPETAATGYLDIVNGAGPGLGEGQALLHFQGDMDAGAPPATAGFAHVVDFADVVIAYNAVPA